jgi:hypothetical protein
MAYGAGSAAMNRTIYPQGWSGGGRSRSWGPSPLIYWAKLAFEQWWLWRYF